MFKKIFTVLMTVLALAAMTTCAFADRKLLPAPGELTEEQAVERAKAFLSGWDAPGLDKAKAEPTLDEDTEDFFDDDGTQVFFKGRHTWSVVLRPGIKEMPYAGASHVDMLSTGEILGYSVPALEYMFMTGTLPDSGAIPEDQALEAGRKALAENLGIPESELARAKAYFGYINIMDEPAAGAKYNQRVWGVDSGLDFYALLSPGGELIGVRKKPDFITE